MPSVTIPNNWSPREYQLPLVGFLQGGGKRAVAVWHRRAGKDSVALNMTVCAAFQRVGTYWHMLPQQAQARKVIWDGIDREGRRMIDQVFPEVVRGGKASQQEMKISLVNGSMWQLCGSDNFDSLVGANPVGVVFSEYSVADPQAWDYIRPILAENGGWALFIYTPRGKNHGYRLLMSSREDDRWFSEILTVEDTGTIPMEAIDDERKAGMSEEMIQQEFFCSFHGLAIGEKVYPTFKYDFHVSKKPLLPFVCEGIGTTLGGSGNTVVVRGWDHTGLHPGAVLTYLNSIGQWLIFKEFHGKDIDIVDFGKMVQAWCGQNLPGQTVYRDIGDPAGKSRDSVKMSAQDYLRRECKLSIQDGIQDFKVRRSAVTGRLNSTKMGEPAILIDPGCDLLIEGFQGAYAFPEISNSGIFRDKVLKNDHADVHDALQYPATRLFPVANLPNENELYPEIYGTEGA